MAELPALPTAPGPPTAAALELAVKAGALKALTDLLVPGTVLSARVVEPLGMGTYLFALRGRTLVAQSPVPLAADSIASLQVLGGGDQPRLRLLAAVPRDQASTTPSHERLAALGLADDEPARAALAGFERAGAPLERGRLAAAAAALAATPPEARPALAAVHAALARAGLPVVPLTVALAARAGAGDVPALAAALTRLTAPARPPAAGAIPPSMDAGAPTARTAPTTPAAPAAANAPAPGTVAAETTRPAPAPAPPPAIPAAVAGPGASAIAPPTTPALAMAEALRLLSEAAAAADDPGDGPEAAERTLRRAGLRPLAEDGPGRDHRRAGRAVDERPSPLMARLADLVVRLHALGHEAAEPARTALVEAGAQALVPPEELADYDLVLPLAVADRGAPTPARLAVARRVPSGGGPAATYLRVDAELSRLGLVSARLAALDGGAVTVQVVAARAAHDALAATMPGLEAALAARGQPARVRLVETDQADG